MFQMPLLSTPSPEASLLRLDCSLFCFCLSCICKSYWKPFFFSFCQNTSRCVLGCSHCNMYFIPLSLFPLISSSSVLIQKRKAQCLQGLKFSVLGTDFSPEDFIGVILILIKK